MYYYFLTSFALCAFATPSFSDTYKDEDLRKNEEIVIHCPSCKQGQNIINGRLVPTSEKPRISGRCIQARVASDGHIGSAPGMNSLTQIEGENDATTMIIPSGTYQGGFVPEGSTSINVSDPSRSFTAPRDGHLMRCRFDMVGGSIIENIYVDDKEVTVEPPKLSGRRH